MIFNSKKKKTAAAEELDNIVLQIRKAAEHGLMLHDVRAIHTAEDIYTLIRQARGLAFQYGLPLPSAFSVIIDGWKKEALDVYNYVDSEGCWRQLSREQLYQLFGDDRLPVDSSFAGWHADRNVYVPQHGAWIFWHHDWCRRLIESIDQFRRCR